MILVKTFVALNLKLIIKLKVNWHDCRVINIDFSVENFVRFDKNKSKVVSCVIKIDEQNSSHHLIFDFLIFDIYYSLRYNVIEVFPSIFYGCCIILSIVVMVFILMKNIILIKINYLDLLFF